MNVLFCRREATDDAVKQAKKSAEHVAEQAQSTDWDVMFAGISLDFSLEQGEKLKRQASDASDKVKATAKDVKKQVEKRSEGLGDKLFSILNDVKNSILGK